MNPTFLYPPDIVDAFLSAWAAFQDRRYERETSLLPSRSDLLSILGTIYHASLLREETRLVSLRCMYHFPSESSETPRGNMPEHVYRFETPLPLTTPDLLRIAPAVHAHESALCIAPGHALGHQPSDQLFVWAVAHFGSDWSRLLTAEDDGAMCPPNRLMVTVLGPGALALSTAGTVLLRIRNGDLVTAPLPDLSEGQIGSFFSNGATALYQDAIAALKLPRFDPADDSNEHPKHSYFRMLRRMIHLVREYGHGGTLLFVPHDYALSESRLADRASVKYHLQAANVWQMLVAETTAHYHYYRLRVKRVNGPNPPEPKMSPSEKKKIYLDLDGTLRRVREKLESYCRFVAQLSNVDGAVVVNDRLSVLGFGAEIMATSPSLTTVRAAKDPYGTKWTEMPLNSMGTRHRSAIRVCSSLEHCVAVVVSQDGPVRAIRRVGPQVYTWSDVGMGELTL